MESSYRSDQSRERVVGALALASLAAGPCGCTRRGGKQPDNTSGHRVYQQARRHRSAQVFSGILRRKLLYCAVSLTPMLSDAAALFNLLICFEVMALNIVRFPLADPMIC